jgi:hypothetical protein
MKAKIIKKIRPSYILRSLANRLISSKKLSVLIYKIFGYKHLAYLLFLSIEKGKYSVKKPSILCIQRDLFSKDIVELRRNAKKLNWLIIGTPQLAYIQYAWIPEKLRHQIEFQRYFTEEYVDKWQKSKIFAEKFLKMTVKKLNVKAVLSANIDYWQEEGLRRACKVLKIPFLVLSKENCIIDSVFKELVEDYKRINFKFTGDGVAVFGSNMKEVLVESNSCRSKDVYVTGAPRLDAWKNIGKDIFSQDTLTLLPYGREYCLSSDQHFMSILDMFLTYAKKYYKNHLYFIVKCKNNKYKLYLEKKIKKEDLKYIRLTVSQQLPELFTRSRVIIGYNSMALVEALLSKAIIAVPQWGEIGKDYKYQQFNPEDKLCIKNIEFLENRKEMEKLLKKAVDNELDNVNIESRIRLLKRYMFYDPDRNNSSYVEEFVLSYIKN